MSDKGEHDTSNQPSKLTLSEAQHLRKAEIVEQLRQRGLEVDEATDRDTLRTQLVAIVKHENSTVDANTVGETSSTRSTHTESTESEDENSSSSTQSAEEMSRDVKIFFHLESDDWEAFQERLELYYEAKKITDTAIMRAELLTRCDEDTYKLIRNLCAPSKPKEKSYEDLIKLVSEHLNPPSSEVMERCIYNRARQEQSETVAEFATRLRQLSLHCNFKDVNEALRDQFICGIREDSTRVELFKQSSVTFETALKEATARESAMKNAEGAQRSLTEKSYKHENFALDHQNQYKAKHEQQRRTDQGRETKQTYVTVCYCCGNMGHATKACRYRDLTCRFCSTKGHLERACIKKKKAGNQFLQGKDNEAEDEQHDEEKEINGQEHNYYVDFHAINPQRDRYRGILHTSEADPMFMKVSVNGKLITMEIDTGSYFTVMSEGFVTQNFKDEKVTKAETHLCGYENNSMEPRGQLENLTIALNGETKTLNCLILKGDKMPLIGRQWLKAFGLWPLNVPKHTDITGKYTCEINKLEVNNVRDKLLSEFGTLFSETPGIYNKREIKLQVKPNTKPVVFRARQVPYAIKPKVEEEIERLLKLGHLEKVEASDWATPIVPVLKGNGNVRICGDFKITLNPHLVVMKRTFLRIDDIFRVLQNGLLFSQLDLPHAYMQVQVEKESREFLTVTTHVGLFRYTKMTEGTTVAPGEFQQIMDECLQGIPHVIAYMDNIFVTGKTHEEHIENLRRVCERLTERGLRLNRHKCEILKEKIEVLGFVISKDGLHKSASKVRVMYEAPRPIDTKQLTSFLGLVNFYARFLENRSDRLRPLFECANAEKLIWTKECEEAFRWVKNEMISPRVLAHYDPDEIIILAGDASYYGLSAILSHRYKDNTERPIAFASKKIPLKELNRAINDKEAAAIVFGFIKFYDFVYGRRVILRTDHKPLETIFGSKRGIPLTAASRLQRWAYFLSGFDYEIEWIRSHQNGNCDALSRLPIDDDTNIFGEEAIQMNFISENAAGIDCSTVIAQTKRDITLAKIMKFCIFGWPSENKFLSEEEKKYFVKRDELAVEQNCLFWGLRIVIPQCLRGRLLDDFHASHLGIVKIKALARSYVWWPGIDGDIENIVKSCKVCIENQRSPSRAPLTPWPWAERAWQRIHSDFLGPFHGDMYLVIVDSYSKWPEVINFRQNTKANKLVDVFQTLFARHGLPDHLITDNGRQFSSHEFNEFLDHNGVKHTFSPPYHPATNGAAENFVGIFKDKVSKIIQGGVKIEVAINQFLFDYRSTPHSTTNESPAYLFYKRQLKTRFDLLRPNLRERMSEKQGLKIVSTPHSRNINLKEGDQILTDNYGVSGGRRIEGEIAKQLSTSTFQIKTESGAIIKRHTDQIVTPARRSERIANNTKHEL